MIIVTIVSCVIVAVTLALFIKSVIAEEIRWAKLEKRWQQEDEEWERYDRAWHAWYDSGGMNTAEGRARMPKR